MPWMKWLAALRHGLAVCFVIGLLKFKNLGVYLMLAGDRPSGRV